MSLPIWKIRRRFKLEGNCRHTSNGGTNSENNRHWDPLLNGNAGGFRDADDEEGTRAMEDATWKEINDWIYGAAMALGDQMKATGATKDMKMDLFRISKCCPSIPDFVRRRLERTHPRHQRTSICFEIMVNNVLNRWKKANFKAARDVSQLEPQLRVKWQKMFLGSTICSVLILIPEELRGRDVVFETVEPTAPGQIQGERFGVYKLMNISVPTGKLTLSVFIKALHEELHQGTAQSINYPTPKHLYLYTGRTYTNGYPQEPYAKNEILDDYDFYRYTTLHPHVGARDYGLWFKVVMHPRNVTAIDDTVPIRQPLRRYRNYGSYFRNTSIVVPSDYVQMTQPIAANLLANPPTPKIPARMTHKTPERWIAEGHHYRKATPGTPGKPVSLTAEEMVSSCAEPDSEQEGQEAQALMWQQDYDRGLARDRAACGIVVDGAGNGP